MLKRILLTAALLGCASAADAGPLQRLLGRGRCHGAGCQPTATQPAPQWVPATPAAPVVVQTSYAGLGVPVDVTPYRPIAVGVPLPVVPQSYPNCPGGR